MTPSDEMPKGPAAGKPWWQSVPPTQTPPATESASAPVVAPHPAPPATPPTGNTPELGPGAAQIEKDRKANRVLVLQTACICAALLVMGLLLSAGIDFFGRQPLMAATPYRLEVHTRTPGQTITAWVEWSSLPPNQPTPELKIDAVNSKPVDIPLSATPVTITLGELRNVLSIKCESPRTSLVGVAAGRLYFRGKTLAAEATQFYPVKLAATSWWESWRTFCTNLIGVGTVAFMVYAVVLWMNPSPFGKLVIYEKGDIRLRGAPATSWHGASSRNLRVSDKLPIRKPRYARLLPWGRNRIRLTDLHDDAPDFELTFYRWSPLAIGRKHFQIFLDLPATPRFRRLDQVPSQPLAREPASFPIAARFICLRVDSGARVFLHQPEDSNHFHCVELIFRSDSDR